MESDENHAKLANGAVSSTAQSFGGLDFRSLVSVPATAAILLGLIYAVGALTRSAELTNAGVALRVAFPLIPIEQELTRGVAVLVQRWQLLAIILFATAVGPFAIAHERKKHRQQANDTTKAAGAHSMSMARRVSQVVLGGILLILTVVVAPILFMSTVVGALATFAAWWATPKVLGRPRRAGRAFNVPALAAVTFVVSSLAFELIAPSPLPRATLQSTPGSLVSGSLITFADDTWYLETSSGQVLAIDSREVTTAAIRPPAPNRLANETLWRLLGL